MNPTASRSLLALSFAGLAAHAAAQDQVLIAAGDALVGGAEVNSVLDLSIAPGGHWAATVGARFGSVFLGDALVRDGQLLLLEGDALPTFLTPAPFEGTLELDVDDSGTLAWIAAPGEALLLDLWPVAEAGGPLMGPGVVPGTVWDRFLDVAHLGGGELLVRAQLLDPSGDAFSAVVRLAPNAMGAYDAAFVRAAGDVVPGLPSPVFKIGDSDEDLGLAPNGSLALRLNQQSLDTGAIFVGDQLVAREGDPSAVPGNQWIGFERVGVALNDAGDVAFVGRSAGVTSGIEELVANGQLVARTGGDLAAIAPFELTELTVPIGGTPLAMDDDGRVVWWGGWDANDSAVDEGLFLGDQLLLQSGVSSVAGQLVEEVRRSEGSKVVFDLLDNGSQLGALVVLEGGRSAAITLDLGTGVLPLDGCLPNLGTLTSDGLSLGQTATFTMDAAQTTAALAVVALSTGLSPFLGPCDLPLGSGGLLIDPNGLLPLTQTGALATGGPVTAATTDVPNVVALLGLTLYSQGAWFDPSAAEQIRPTGGLALTIGL